MTDKELMQQALEALEWEWGGEPMGSLTWKAITALRERLAQPETMTPKELAERIKRGEKWQVDFPNIGCVQHDCDECQARLAQPEQERMAPYGRCPQCGAIGIYRERRPNGNDKCANGHTYPAAQAVTTPQQPEQEPVAYVDALIDRLLMPPPSMTEQMLRELHKEAAKMIHLMKRTTPQPRREWVGLTDEEVNACDPQEECWNLLEVARAIEAKLRKKNS